MWGGFAAFKKHSNNDNTDDGHGNGRFRKERRQQGG